jgi:hypothetical protein
MIFFLLLNPIVRSPPHSIVGGLVFLVTILLFISIIFFIAFYT